MTARSFLVLSSLLPTSMEAPNTGLRFLTSCMRAIGGCTSSIAILDTTPRLSSATAFLVSLLQLDQTSSITTERYTIARTQKPLLTWEVENLRKLVLVTRHSFRICFILIPMAMISSTPLGSGIRTPPGMIMSITQTAERVGEAMSTSEDPALAESSVDKHCLFDIDLRFRSHGVSGLNEDVESLNVRFDCLYIMP
jgi:hypothetical protein